MGIPLVGHQGSAQKKMVTINDAANFLGSFQCGALGVFETSNMSAGRKNALIIGVNGRHGSIRFDLERMNELDVNFADEQSETQGFRRIMVTQPEHAYIKNWWPAGHVIGWEHTFVHQIYEFFKAISEGYIPEPSFLDGLKCQEVVEAAAHADETHQWVAV